MLLANKEALNHFHEDNTNARQYKNLVLEYFLCVTFSYDKAISRPNQSLESWMHLFLTIENFLVPFKMKRVRIPASASWLISEIKRLMRERDPRIKRIAVSTKDQTKWIKYKN